MPLTTIHQYCEKNGDVPFSEWLDELEESEPRARVKFFERIKRLHQLGHEMRRPHADLLRDNIYELRVRIGNVHYRALYCFYGQNAALLTHGFSKTGAVPPAQINKAIEYRKRVLADPDSHIAEYEYEL